MKPSLVLFAFFLMATASLIASALADGPAGSGLLFPELADVPQGIRINAPLRSTIDGNVFNAAADLVFAADPASGCAAGVDPSNAVLNAISFGLNHLSGDKLSARLYIFADLATVPVNTAFLVCYDRAGTGAVSLTAAPILVKLPSVSLVGAPLYLPVWYNPTVSLTGNFFWSYNYDNTEQPTYFLRSGSVADPNVCNSSANLPNAQSYGNGFSDKGAAAVTVGYSQQTSLVLCIKPATYSPGLVLPRVQVNFVTVNAYSQSVSSFVVTWDSAGVFSSTPSKIIISYTVTGPDGVPRKRSHTVSGSNMTSFIEYVDPSPLTTTISNLVVRFGSSNGTVRTVVIGTFNMSKLTAVSNVTVNTSNPDVTTFVITYPTNYSLSGPDSLALQWDISINVAPGTVLSANNVANPAANQLTWQNNIATIAIPNSAWTGGSFPADLAANPLTSVTVGYSLYGGVAPTFTKSL